MNKLIKGLIALFGVKVTKQAEPTKTIEGTTSVDGKDKHSHKYIKQNGAGLTTETIGEGSKHIHVILDDKISPADTDQHVHTIETENPKMTREELAQLAMDFESEKQATENGLADNPPSWVDDEAKWDRAKGISEDSFGEVRWPFVTWFYLNKLDGGKK